jgi:hypothetical protein
MSFSLSSLWKNYFKPVLADQLINAVRAKNPDQVIKASRELGETCTKCHTENQIAVKLVYHYPPFATLNMEDPVEFVQLSPKEYMRKLSDSMKALRISSCRVMFKRRGKRESR